MIKVRSLNVSASHLFENVIAILFALRAITYIWLAFASDIYSPVYADIVMYLRYFTIIAGLAYIVFKQKGFDAKKLTLTIPVIYYYLMLVFNTYGGYQGSYIHEVISIVCFLLMNNKMKQKTFNIFYRLILVTNAISIVLYVLYMVHIRMGFISVPFYNNGVLSSYYQKFLIFAIVDGGYSMPRLCGIFNEPGALGTVCALLFALTYQKSSLREKAILLMATLFTMSLAGFVLIIAYMVILLAQKSWKYAAIVLALIAFFFMIPQIDWGNEEINRFAKRFAITTQGLAGDDRTSLAVGFDEEYQNLLHSSEAFFGKGATYTADSGASSYKNLIMQFGILGFGIYLILWLYAALKESKGNRECVVFLLVFLISIYQRPVTIVNSYGYMLVFGGFCWYNGLTMHEKKLTTEDALLHELISQ